MRGHAHLTTLFDDNEANFSHRIDRFSFGDPHGSIIQPLEGDEKVTDNGKVNVLIVLLSYLLTTSNSCEV